MVRFISVRRIIPTRLETQGKSVMKLIKHSAQQSLRYKLSEITVIVNKSDLAAAQTGLPNLTIYLL